MDVISAFYDILSVRRSLVRSSLFSFYAAGEEDASQLMYCCTPGFMMGGLLLVIIVIGLNFTPLIEARGMRVLSNWVNVEEGGIFLKQLTSFL